MNLVGYCEEKNQRILVYEYMSHGSLEQRLVGKVLMRSGEYICSTSCLLQSERNNMKKTDVHYSKLRPLPAVLNLPHNLAESFYVCK